MEGQFRKSLQSFDAYKINSHYFLSEVEKGSPGILDSLLGQVQFIITDHHQEIIKKVLATRFCKDLMVLGRSDVIKGLQRIVPHIVKVCEHRYNQQSPDRGQTYFEFHPQYLKADQQEKRQIQMYASTYFTLNMESILHWAKWVPSDEFGNQSIFSIQYTNLLKKGVKFHTNYLYYKLSDTERFKNTYKMEFFSESSFMDDQSGQSSKNSRISHKSRSSVLQNFSKQLTNVQKIKNSLNLLQSETKQNYNKLDIVNLNCLTIFEAKYMNQKRKCSQKEKHEKRWLERQIINYSLLKNKKINYDQFMKKSTSQVVNLSAQEQVFTQNDFSQRDRQIFVKSKKSATVTYGGGQQKNYYEDLLRKQQEQYSRQIDGLKKGRQIKEKQIQKLKKKYEKDQQVFKGQYQGRINTIKKGILEHETDKSGQIFMQNQKLKQKIFELQKQKASKNTFKNAEREKEKQINLQIKKLYKEVEIVKSENEKLKGKIHNSGNSEIYLSRIKELERELEEQRKQKQSLLRQSSKENQAHSSFEEINKKNKQLQNLTDQIRIYKNQLTNERLKNDKKQKNIQNRLSQAQSENKLYRERISKLQKKLDLRDIEAAQLCKQIKLYKNFDKEMLILQEHEKEKSVHSQLKSPKSLQSPRQSPLKQISLKYDAYKGLRSSFKENKQNFIRFCRCSLKKKDLLMKQNELEVGLISESVSSYEMNFIIHFTNMSNTQFENIQISLEHENEYEVQLSTQFIFCIQRQEQQKIIINCKARTNKILELPLILYFNYEKNKKIFTTKLNLPFINYKLFTFQEINQNYSLFLDKKESIKVNYSKKILSQPKNLKSYYPPIKEVQNKKYQVDLFHTKTRQLIRVCFSFQKEQQLKIYAIPIDQEQLIYDKEQQEILHDLISFLQFVFKK